jgi:hypothetical protein
MIHTGVLLVAQLYELHMREVCTELDDAISPMEVRFALRKMKLGKAVGPYQVPTELVRIIANPAKWKVGQDVWKLGVRLLMEIINRIHDTGDMSSVYKDTVPVKLFKKGDPTNANSEWFPAQCRSKTNAQLTREKKWLREQRSKNKNHTPTSANY